VVHRHRRDLNDDEMLACLLVSLHEFVIAMETEDLGTAIHDLRWGELLSECWLDGGRTGPENSVAGARREIEALHRPELARLLGIGIESLMRMRVGSGTSLHYN
jgi:hypothetical protein